MISAHPGELTGPQYVPIAPSRCSENMPLAFGIAATAHPAASASLANADAAPKARSLTPATRTGLTAALNSSAAPATASASARGSLAAGIPMSRLHGTAVAAPAMLHATSRYTGVRHRSAVSSAWSIWLGASAGCLMMCASPVTWAKMSRW